MVREVILPGRIFVHRLGDKDARGGPGSKHDKTDIVGFLGQLCPRGMPISFQLLLLTYSKRRQPKSPDFRTMRTILSLVLESDRHSNASTVPLVKAQTYVEYQVSSKR